MHEANNTALAAQYPCVAQLVGEKWFSRLSTLYADQAPQEDHFGDAFAHFLESLDAIAGLPYLPDIARLERACRTAERLEPSQPLDLTELAQYSPERLAAGRFYCHPNTHLCASPYPIFQIWEAIQQGEMKVAALQPSEAVLVFRDREGVHIERLGKGEALLLATIRADRPFAEACDTALKHDPGLDVASLVARWASCGILARFQPPGDA